MRWCYWQGNELVIHRLRVRVLAEHQAPVTKQYNLVPAKVGDLFGWESNRTPGGK